MLCRGPVRHHLRPLHHSYQPHTQFPLYLSPRARRLFHEFTIPPYWQRTLYTVPGSTMSKVSHGRIDLVSTRRISRRGMHVSWGGWKGKEALWLCIFCAVVDSWWSGVGGEVVGGR